MKFTYDADADAISIFWGETEIEESDEVAPDVILDYDAQGAVLGVEILNASKRVEYLTPELAPAFLQPEKATAEAT